MNRRSFLTFGAAMSVGAVNLLRGPRKAEAFGQSEPPPGEARLNLSDTDRDATVYIPKSYKSSTAMPLLMMLHGFSGTSQSVRYTFPLAEEFGVIIIAPESRGQTWGQSAPGFDSDMTYLAAAYREVATFLNVDRSHVALGGVSDGATYAISMGLAYGDTFNHLMIFSEGIPIPYRKQGKPKLFIAHGLNDTQMPIDRTSRRFVPQFKEEGYDVTYREYDGGHGAPAALVREGFEWFVPKTTPL